MHSLDGTEGRRESLARHRAWRGTVERIWRAGLGEGQSYLQRSGLGGRGEVATWI